MSSEIDHPRQRTVAELLAAHGDAGATGGRRRRRREAEPDTSESVDDAAFVFGGAAPQVAGWSPDRSVLRDPVPPDDGSATWDPIAGRAANESALRKAGLPGDAGRAGLADAATRGWGADDGGVGPGAVNRAPRNGYPDDLAQYGRPPAGGGSDGRNPNRSDPNRSDPNRYDTQRSDRYRPEPDRPGGYGPGPGPGSAGAWTGGGWDDDAGGWSADSGQNGGAGDRPNGDAAGAGRRNGRGSGVANGWSGGSDAGTSSWSSGGSPDRFGPDLPASNGWAQGSVPPGTPGDTAYSDVPRRNGANRPAAGSNARSGSSSGGNAYGANAYSGDPSGGDPNRGDPNRGDLNRGDPNRGNPLGGRSSVDPRAANGSPARAGLPADPEAGRTQGDPARLAAPPRDPAWGPRAGDAQPAPRRVPDTFTEQFAPVRTDGTAVLDSVRARPRPPVGGVVEDDRGSGPATQVSAPVDLDDPWSAGSGRAGPGRATSDRSQVAAAVVDDPAGPDVADLDLDDPSATDIRSHRPAPARSSSSGQAWAGVLGQWILGALGGAALWVGFRFLWQELTVVAIAAAVLVTVGLVLVVRHLLRNDDRRTTVFAVLIGLLLTVSPALLVMLHR